MTPDTSIYEYAGQGLAASRDRTALWFCGKGMTYADLFRRIDNAADHLAALGVGMGTVVTIHLPNCPQAVMAVYAVAKLGGISSMVHPQVPLEGLRENMAFTESKILITGDHFSRCGEVDFADKLIHAGLAAHMGPVYGLAYRLKKGGGRPAGAISFETLERPAVVPARVPEQASLAEECAVYLHSSGTTGTPKTVMHCHRALNCWVENAKRFFKGRELTDQTLLSALPLFHGSGLVMNMHQLLAGGGQQVLMAQWNSREAVRLIKRRNITILTGVPALYRSLLDEPGFSGPRIRQIGECFVSGDYVGSQLKREFDSRVDGKRHLFEGYGMTETVTACFSNGKERDRLASSGYPLENCEIAVLGGDSVPRRTGAGEFLVSTNTLMLGYRKDPAGTSAAFVTWEGRQWLRTGDCGRIDGDGYVYFQERLKNVIVRKGYNIFPSQIESVIHTLAEVREVCVVGVPDEMWGTQTVRACVVLCEGMDPGQAEWNIRSACARVLPRYAVPREIRFLAELPRNRMSKIDRKALEQLP